MHSPLCGKDPVQGVVIKPLGYRLRPESLAGFTSRTVPNPKPEKLLPPQASAAFYASN